MGAIAPGYEADMVLVKDLKDFETVQVFIDGNEVPADFKLKRMEYPEYALNSIKLKELKPGDLRIDAPAGRDAAV